MEFKTGDWVKYKDQQNNLTYKVIELLPNDLIDIGDTITDKYDIELWQPKNGEWVVIADDIIPDLYAVFQFNNHSRDRPIYPLEFLQTLKD